MRSTWTWDDRALRRDLSDLLVRVDASELVGADDQLDGAVGAALHARARAFASNFVATVLGPKLVADSVNPLRVHFFELAADPAFFGRRAHAATKRVQTEIDQYFEAHILHVDYPTAADWSALVAKEGATGLGNAMRA